MSKVYILQKDYESPYCKIYKGVSETEDQWIRIFPGLIKGDCEIKKDWFLPKEEPKEYELYYKDSNCSKIHIVKRLSDGETFSVGDRVLFNNTCTKILGFEFVAESDFFISNNTPINVETQEYLYKKEKSLRVQIEPLLFEKFRFVTINHINKIKDKLYTEEEVLKREEKAFNAARQHKDNKIYIPLGESLNKYDSFQDYKNSQRQNSK